MLDLVNRTVTLKRWKLKKQKCQCLFQDVWCKEFVFGFVSTWVSTAKKRLQLSSRLSDAVLTAAVLCLDGTRPFLKDGQSLEIYSGLEPLNVQGPGGASDNAK